MPSQTAPVTGTATVSVACKIPQGMRLVLHQVREFDEVTLGGTRRVKESYPTDREFTVRGPAHAQNEGPRGRVVGGYAITRGVPKDLWDEWVKQFAALPAVKNGMIFAYESDAKVVDAARDKDHKAVRTGLERLNPNELPQIDPRFKVQTADEQVTPIGQLEEA